MRQKACKNCGAVFETDKRGAYLCPDCAAESRRKSVYRTRVCIDCGAEFMGFPKSKRCPECQDLVNRNRDAAFKRNGPARPIGSTDLCEKCGEPYIVGSGNQRYCKNCAAESVKSNVLRHKREYQVQYISEHTEERAANRSFNKVCVVCGKVFDTDLPTVTCSPECDRIRRKLQQEKTDLKRGRRHLPPGETYESGLPKSGITGVTFSRKSKKWCACFKKKYIGSFETIEEAANAIENFKEEQKMKMTDKQFLFCVQEAPNYSDRDAYVSDISLSSVWDDADSDSIPTNRIEAVGSVFDAINRSVSDIASAAGLSHRKLAERFCVPYRTVENWCTGVNACPLYVRLMMQECLHLLSR